MSGQCGNRQTGTKKPVPHQHIVVLGYRLFLVLLIFQAVLDGIEDICAHDIAENCVNCVRIKIHGPFSVFIHDWKLQLSGSCFSLGLLYQV